MPQVKVSSQNVLDFVLASIREKLSKQEPFLNTSLSYFGCDLDFTVELTLYSRKPDSLTVVGADTMSKISAEEVIDSHKTHVTVSDKVEKGRKNKVAGTTPDYSPAGVK